MSRTKIISIKKTQSANKSFACLMCKVQRILTLKIINTRNYKEKKCEKYSLSHSLSPLSKKLSTTIDIRILLFLIIYECGQFIK